MAALSQGVGVALLLLASTAAAARAQVPPAVGLPRPPVASFEQLTEVVKPGALVVVTTSTGQLRGELVRLDRASLGILLRGQIRHVPATSVTRLRLRRNVDRVAEIGGIIGGLVGLTGAIVVSATTAKDDPLRGDSLLMAWTAFPVMTLGAGYWGGWLVGRLWPGTTLYTAPTVTVIRDPAGGARPRAAESRTPRVAHRSQAAMEFRLDF